MNIETDNIELKEINDDEVKNIIHRNVNEENIKWTFEHENILVEWADKAMCYRWLHTKSRLKFGRINTFLTIPVIIMSTLTGTANFAQDKIPDDYKEYYPMIIGGINIIAGILTTIQQFLKISEFNEAHRVASIAWDKFYRNTKVELAKAPTERLPVIQMIKLSKEEFDRLMETSPPISQDIVRKFKKTFSGGLKMNKIPEILTQKQINYLEIKKPEICGVLETTKKIVYDKKKHELSSPRKRTLSAVSLARKAVDLKRKQNKIEDIIINYLKLKKRQPTLDEILDELDEEIESKVVLSFMEQYNKKKHNKLEKKTTIKDIPKEQSLKKVNPKTTNDIHNIESIYLNIGENTNTINSNETKEDNIDNV